MESTKSFTDEDLIRGLTNNEAIFLRALYRMNYPMVLNFVINNSGSADDARDIFQDAVVVLYNNLNDQAFELRCRLKTYLYSVCRRLWLNELKAKRKFVGDVYDYEEFIEIETVEEEKFHENENKFQLIQQSLQMLGEPCATILKDFYVNNASMNEIVEKMGYTNSDNAKNQKYKCLQRLKKIYFSLYKMKKLIKL
jgi:RNA polymerase sigma factor (sigma-70 family)